MRSPVGTRIGIRCRAYSARPLLECLEKLLVTADMERGTL